MHPQRVLNPRSPVSHHPSPSVATIDVNRLRARRLALVGSRWLGADRPRLELYHRAAALIESGLFDPSGLVEMTVSLETLEDAFEAVAAREVLKAVCMVR